MKYPLLPPASRLLNGLRPACAAFLLGAAILVATGGFARADVYVSDFVSNTVTKYANDGSSPTTFVSNLNGPVGLAVDASGDIYEADSYSGNIYEFTPAGVQKTVASGFDRILGLAFDKAGNLFAAVNNLTTNIGSVIEITPAGTQSTFATNLGLVRGLAFDASGNLYVADIVDGIIYEYTPAGVQSTFAAGLTNPTGLAFNAAGNLFVACQGAGVYEVTPAGAVSQFTNLSTDPRYLAFDASGNLLVTDAGDGSGNPGQGNVYSFTPSGAQTTFASGLAYATGIVVVPALAPVVTVEATGPAADSGTGQNGQFTLSRSGSSDALLVVDYVVKGTATPGVDYVMLSGKAKFKPGKTTKVINIVPEGTLGGAPRKTVKLVLRAGNGYTVGAASSAKVKITHTNIIILP